MYKQYSSLICEEDEDRFMADYWSKQWSALSTEQKLSHLGSSELWSIFRRHVDPGQPIIEAGCGLAQWVVFLQRGGHDIVGVDFSLPALVSAKHAFPDIELLQCDVRRLPFPDGRFGIYMSLGVVEHFEGGPDKVLQEAVRVLRPHGLLLIAVPLHTWLTQKAAVKRQKREGNARFFQYLYTYRELEELLKKNGFATLEMHSWGCAYTMRCLFPNLYEKASESWRQASGLNKAAVVASKVMWRILGKAAPRGLCGHMQVAVAVRS